MSTIAIIAIVVGAVIVLAILFSVFRRAGQQKGQPRKLGKVQQEAQRDDVRHHQERAEESRSEAAMAQKRADRAKAEAELNEEQARQREQQLGTGR